MGEMMKMSNAINKAKFGEFEFINDARLGYNEIRYYNKKGKEVHKVIEITRG